MKGLTTFFAAAVLTLAAGSANADMTVIGFDHLGNGISIDDQFIDLGADFNGLARTCATCYLYPAHSGSYVIENLHIDPLTNEIKRVDITVNSAGPNKWLMAGGYVTGVANVTLTAYDSSDNKLVNLSGPDSTGEANTYDLGEDKPNMFLSVSAPNIDYVIFSLEIAGIEYSDNDIFTVDDFTFAPVPVPGAVLLGILGLGVASLKLRKFV